VRSQATTSTLRQTPTMDILQSIDPTSSSSSLSDPYRPSFFELFAQEQLRDLLSPALRYVLSVLAQRHPRYLLRIVNRFEEIYALGMYAVERHYLKTWGENSCSA
jgi:peroxin-12